MRAAIRAFHTQAAHQHHHPGQQQAGDGGQAEAEGGAPPSLSCLVDIVLDGGRPVLLRHNPGVARQHRHVQLEEVEVGGGELKRE